MNSSQVLFFTLGAYADPGPLRFLFFLLVLVLLLLIVFCNLLLIVVICVSRSLHEPMFLFLCSLFVNELLGSSGLFPFLLLQILADVHRVSAPLCFLQVFVLYLYGSVEFFVLAVMSYDRYVAICRPLQYHRLMTPQKVAVLLALTWALPFLTISVLVGMSAALPLCGNVIDRIYCGNYAIVKLSCSDTRLNNIYGLAYTVLSVLLPSLSILYSYARILQVCCSGSRQTRQKALSTCTPHLASILNFSFGCCFQILQSRFDRQRGSDPLQVFMSLYFLTCQPLFTPLLYGLKMTRIQDACQQLLCGGRAARPELRA
ncbi:olfactory receptor 10A6-like [Oryzias melastigma]|uniref:olfactory receptor 10A6-like n=1 Tax=Oryzias melastigma TaxID=30732 RepID=UPI000CF7DA00|nr:olfactory receptor 10A6-like [Oryzias melastigma]